MHPLGHISKSIYINSVKIISIEAHYLLQREVAIVEHCATCSIIQLVIAVSFPIHCNVKVLLSGGITDTFVRLPACIREL